MKKRLEPAMSAMPAVPGVWVVAAVAAVAVVGLFSGCTANDSLANQYRAGDNKNYIAGDGAVTEFSAASRGAAIRWAGATQSGEVISSEALAGVVTVMNFWYAGCAPCRAEAPDLVALQSEFDKVQFVGVNVRDSGPTSAAFEKNFKITWPSVLDAKTGSVLLSFTGIVTPQAVPTTIVIGKDGKVTARVLGRIDKSILRTLIKSAIAE